MNVPNIELPKRAAQQTDTESSQNPHGNEERKHCRSRFQCIGRLNNFVACAAARFRAFMTSRAGIKKKHGSCGKGGGGGGGGGARRFFVVATEEMVRETKPFFLKYGTKEKN